MAQTKKAAVKAPFVADPDILVWTAANRGIVTRIAKKVRTSPEQVSMVLSGRRKGVGPVGQKVRIALLKAGAPLRG